MLDHDLEEDKMDMDEMEEDQEAIEMLKSSQYSNNNHNYMMKGGGNKQQHGSLGSSPQPRRNTTNQVSRMMDHQ